MSSTLKMPSVNISFTEKAKSAINRGDRGIVAIITKDIANITDVTEIYSESDIPTNAAETTKTLVKLALKGYKKAPKKIILVPVTEPETNGYAAALTKLETIYFNYLVVEDVETNAKQTEIIDWVKNQRTENEKLIKAILPNCTTPNLEYIINYTTRTVTESDNVTYDSEVYCARIAGLIAGTPLNMSCTFAPLDELVDCDRLNKTERDNAIKNGKLILYYDGEKVKVARGINSYTTTSDEKGDQYRKIKLVDAMDMISEDIRTTAEDTYIGKYVNSYDNKCLLISAINQYFATLIPEGVISSGYAEIDIDANKEYLKNKGVNVNELSDDEIKKYNTGDSVFLKAKISLLDTIENIELPITI